MELETTWVRDIDLKIRDLLEETRYTRSSGGEEEFIQPTVEYGRPEGEGEDRIQAKLPIINRRLYHVALDFERIGQNQWQTEVVEETEDEVDLKFKPIPHLLYYEITITTQFTEDLIDLQTQVIKKLPLRGALFLKDDNDEEFGVFIENISMEDAERVHPEKTKQAESKVRRFRSVFRYKLTAELDPHDVKQYYKVKEVIIEDAGTKEGD